MGEQMTGLQRRVDELVFKETMVSTIVRADDDGASRALFDKAVDDTRTEWARRAAKDSDTAVASYSAHTVPKAKPNPSSESGEAPTV